MTEHTDGNGIVVGVDAPRHRWRPCVGRPTRRKSCTRISSRCTPWNRSRADTRPRSGARWSDGRPGARSRGPGPGRQRARGPGAQDRWHRAPRRGGGAARSRAAPTGAWRPAARPGRKAHGHFGLASIGAVGRECLRHATVPVVTAACCTVPGRLDLVIRLRLASSAAGPAAAAELTGSDLGPGRFPCRRGTGCAVRIRGWGRSALVRGRCGPRTGSDAPSYGRSRTQAQGLRGGRVRGTWSAGRREAAVM